MSSAALLPIVSYATIVLSAVWVLVDAKRIGRKKGRLKGFADMGPWGWFFACLLLWIVSFPLYLFKRRQLLMGSDEKGGSTQKVTAI